jgi:hypothetical protein
MRESFFATMLIFVLGAVSARVLGSDSVSSGVVTRLCQHVKERKVMLVDRGQAEIIWSDGAMFEIARTFPRELQELQSAPTAVRDLRPVVTRMSANVTEGWQDAKIIRSGRGQEHAVVESKDGKVTARLASPYFDYLHERYPAARIRIKSSMDPVLFVVDGTLRGSIMPIRTAERTP